MSYIFGNISYLLKGNDKQKRAYKVLKKIEVFDVLTKFNPILVGTIPINIDIENSDLDIMCEVYDFDEFEKVLRTNFYKMKKFKINRYEKDGIKNMVSKFICDEFIIEIFGQSLPTVEQNGYKHMLIEKRLLNIGGDSFKRKIIQLKKEGIKTEPAFAKCLNIEGNPYNELLKLEYFNDEKLSKMIE
jgi:hypothetical protein